MIKLKNILGEISNADNARGTKGYTGFLPSELWDTYMRKLQKSIKNTTGYTIVGLEDLPPDTIKKTDNPINQSDVDDKNISEIIKLKDLLFERIDYEDTAKQIIKSYKLKSKVKIKSGKTKADYDWINDIINLRPSYSTIKDFLMTVLHEIHHALQRKKMGAKKYEKEYQQAGDVAANQGKDFHDDNRFEEAAERWAKSQLSKWNKK